MLHISIISTYIYFCFSFYVNPFNSNHVFNKPQHMPSTINNLGIFLLSTQIKSTITFIRTKILHNLYTIVVDIYNTYVIFTLLDTVTSLMSLEVTKESEVTTLLKKILFTSLGFTCHYWNRSSIRSSNITKEFDTQSSYSI